MLQRMRMDAASRPMSCTAWTTNVPGLFTRHSNRFRRVANSDRIAFIQPSRAWPKERTMLRNLLGSGSKTAEMQAILQQMQEAVARYERLTEGAERSADRLARLGEPIQKASGDVDALLTRVSEVERRFEGMVQLSKLLDSLEDRASSLTHNQQK